MTLDELYRSVYSLLDEEITSGKILAVDINTALNDAIARVRLEYIRAGRGQSFAVVEQLYFSFADHLYPHMGTSDLDYEPVKSVPINQAILNGVVWKTDEFLSEVNPQSFTKGDLVARDDMLLECVESFTSLVTWDLYFEPYNVISFREGNKLLYPIDHMIKWNGSYYRVDETFTNDGTVDWTTKVTKLYWVEKGRASATARFFEWSRINDNVLFNTYVPDAYAFTVKDKQVYVSGAPQQMTISYIPEWEFVYTRGSDINIPSDMGLTVKTMALGILKDKFGGGLVDRRSITPEAQGEG